MERTAVQNFPRGAFPRVLLALLAYAFLPDVVAPAYGAQAGTEPPLSAPHGRMAQVERHVKSGMDGRHEAWDDEENASQQLSRTSDAVSRSAVRLQKGPCLGGMQRDADFMRGGEVYDTSYEGMQNGRTHSCEGDSSVERGSRETSTLVVSWSDYGTEANVQQKEGGNPPLHVNGETLNHQIMESKSPVTVKASTGNAKGVHSSENARPERGQPSTTSVHHSSAPATSLATAKEVESTEDKSEKLFMKENARTEEKRDTRRCQQAADAAVDEQAVNARRQGNGTVSPPEQRKHKDTLSRRQDLRALLTKGRRKVYSVYAASGKYDVVKEQEKAARPVSLEVKANDDGMMSAQTTAAASEISFTLCGASEVAHYIFGQNNTVEIPHDCSQSSFDVGNPGDHSLQDQSCCRTQSGDDLSKCVRVKSESRQRPTAQTEIRTDKDESGKCGQAFIASLEGQGYTTSTERITAADEEGDDHRSTEKFLHPLSEVTARSTPDSAVKTDGDESVTSRDTTVESSEARTSNEKVTDSLSTSSDLSPSGSSKTGAESIRRGLSGRKTSVRPNSLVTHGTLTLKRKKRLQNASRDPGTADEDLRTDDNANRGRSNHAEDSGTTILDDTPQKPSSHRVEQIGRARHSSFHKFVPTRSDDARSAVRSWLIKRLSSFLRTVSKSPPPQDTSNVQQLRVAAEASFCTGMNNDATLSARETGGERVKEDEKAEYQNSCDSLIGNKFEGGPAAGIDHSRGQRRRASRWEEVLPGQSLNKEKGLEEHVLSRRLDCTKELVPARICGRYISESVDGEDVQYNAKSEDRHQLGRGRSYSTPQGEYVPLRVHLLTESPRPALEFRKHLVGDAQSSIPVDDGTPRLHCTHLLRGQHEDKRESSQDQNSKSGDSETSHPPSKPAQPSASRVLSGSTAGESTSSRGDVTKEEWLTTNVSPLENGAFHVAGETSNPPVNHARDGKRLFKPAAVRGRARLHILAQKRREALKEDNVGRRMTQETPFPPDYLLAPQRSGAKVYAPSTAATSPGVPAKPGSGRISVAVVKSPSGRRLSVHLAPHRYAGAADKGSLDNLGEIGGEVPYETSNAVRAQKELIVLEEQECLEKLFADLLSTSPVPDDSLHSSLESHYGSSELRGCESLRGAIARRLGWLSCLMRCCGLDSAFHDSAVKDSNSVGEVSTTSVWPVPASTFEMGCRRDTEKAYRVYNTRDEPPPADSTRELRKRIRSLLRRTNVGRTERG